MAYVQVITPNPNIPCQPGWCLKYVQDTFGIGAKYPTAISAWSASAYKHQDQNFPEGMWVPIWFTMKDVPAGHVALRAPDGSIWSTSHPVANAPYHHPNLVHLMNYYGGRLSYLGWTEDVEDTLVIKGGDMPIPNADNYYGRYRKAMQYIRGRDMSRDEFNKNFVGNTDLQMLEALLDSPEADAQVDYANLGRTAKNDHWDQQIYGLQDQVKALTSQLGENSSAKKQADELQAQVDALTKSVAVATAERDSLQKQAEGDKAVADTLLRRLGQWISKYLPGGK